MKTQNILLIIDMQNDFCLPSGALYVDGAANDVQNLKKFILKNQSSINSIILTQDTHHIIDISHPGFWQDKNGNTPEPFTNIFIEDINSGKWMPKYHKSEAVKYINDLYTKGEFPHTIWPEHCIVGSKGAAIHDDVIEAVSDWARSGNYFEVVTKGLNPLTEHFGALRANIPINSDESTHMNLSLIKKLQNYENIYIAGEAKSHCVANTVKQLCEVEGLPQKIILLEDTMSNVVGFENIADPIYKQAQDSGMKIEKSGNVALK